MSPCNLCSVLKIDKMLLFLITTYSRGTVSFQSVREGARISTTMLGWTQLVGIDQHRGVGAGSRGSMLQVSLHGSLGVLCSKWSLMPWSEFLAGPRLAEPAWSFATRMLFTAHQNILGCSHGAWGGRSIPAGSRDPASASQELQYK